MFEQKDDYQISTYLSPGGIGLSAAYAVTDNRALLISAAYRGNNYLPRLTNNTLIFKHNYMELGYGFYNAENNRRISGMLGAGFGETKGYDIFNHSHTGSPLPVDGSYNRLFVQLNGGWKFSFVEYGGSQRLALAAFNFLKVNNDVSYPIVGFSETVGYLNIGYEYFKFTSQFGLALPVSGHDFNFFSPLIFSLGIQIQYPFEQRSEPFIDLN